MHDVEARSDMERSLVSTNLGDNLQKIANTTFNIDALVRFPEPTKNGPRISSMAALSFKYPKLIFWVVICIFQAHNKISPSYTEKSAPASPSSW